MIERRRRERINDCLNQLKTLVLEATHKDVRVRIQKNVVKMSNVENTIDTSRLYDKLQLQRALLPPHC